MARGTPWAAKVGAAPPLLFSRAHSAVGGEAQRVNLDRSNSGRVELGRGAMLNTIRFCIDDKDYTSNPWSMHYPLNVEGCISLNFLLSRFGVIGSISVEERQNNSQGEVWQVRRVSKQSCPAYGSLQHRSRQPGTGAALLTSQKSLEFLQSNRREIWPQWVGPSHCHQTLCGCIFFFEGLQTYVWREALGGGREMFSEMGQPRASY